MVSFHVNKNPVFCVARVRIECRIIFIYFFYKGFKYKNTVNLPYPGWGTGEGGGGVQCEENVVFKG